MSDFIDMNVLSPLVAATYELMISSPRRSEPDAATAELLTRDLPADLRALLHGWTFHGAPGRGLGQWDLFDRWDFSFAMEPLDNAGALALFKALSGAGARETIGSDGPIVQLGRNAGGVPFLVTVVGGATRVLGPEEGEDYGPIDDFLERLYEWANFEAEEKLRPYLPESYFDPIED